MGREGVFIQYHILHHLEHILRYILVAGGHGRVYYAHVQPCLDGVMEEHAVHSLANLVVAAEGEREVADASAHMHLGHLLMYGATSLDEGSRIVVVLRHTSGYGEHVGVEYYVFCGESYALQQLVGSASHTHLALVGVSLSLFIEKHHHRCCSHRVDVASLLNESLLALLERYGVDYRLALHALESCLEYLPLR